ncbi:TIGR02450 family Trp-rich protein [Shewanella intestini]|uniref:TIGR02450 family Trp-rich protein n=1 Tax=Shewanella intestini TaxID=2017544 RepID=A0ABS5I536_9GAMM|nr:MULTISPECIES: TIGR02450 family Trp-rich protein [Shewanella]MBR9729139.1 TIGR02450 family Trp-rich protein [Shewanella intestini]MRG37290.1 TIGR02450 family Trp-rich protein [Shewanella sp. XMDDZSB0408]
MNRIHPKKLLHSKWTKVDVTQKMKHFSVCEVSFDDNQKVQSCTIRAEFTHQEFAIDWRQLTDTLIWRQGWQ